MHANFVQIPDAFCDLFSELMEGRRDMCAILAKNERGVYIVTYILLTLSLCVLVNDKFSRL